MIASMAVMFVALAGGLWTALLLRQISAAFWITFLAPVGIAVTLMLLLPAKFADNNHVVIPLLYSLAAIYTVAGFWLAHRLFHRAQDAAWTGGVISFSTWRYFSAGTQPVVSARRWRPLAALLKREFQLHSISLFCVGSLLVLHLGIFFLRITYVVDHKNSVAAAFSDLFWTLWLVMPLIIGGTSVAEDRKLGLAESQFCLPVARRTQFAGKFIPVMLFGTLLGGVMPMLLESLAAHFGAPCDAFRPQNQADASRLDSFELGVVALAAGLSWVSFFASTLARNFLQALSISIVIIVGCFMIAATGAYFSDLQFSILGILPWPSVPPILIGVPTLLVILMWLPYRNFKWFQESRRLWLGNLRLILGALLFVFVSSALIYNRAWEVLEPAEPAHGPAKFSPAQPPVLQSDVYGGVQVRLPDGRVWFDNLGYPFLSENQPSRWRQLWWFLADPRPVSVGPRQFIAGSNWVSASAARVDIRFLQQLDDFCWVFGYLDTVGIKSNGTLWISQPGRAESLDRRRDDSIRQRNQMASGRIRQYVAESFLLLKNDGTLWRWGTNHLDLRQWRTNWPTVRNNPPRQIGTNADWQEIFDCGYADLPEKLTAAPGLSVWISRRTKINWNG